MRNRFDKIATAYAKAPRGLSASDATTWLGQRIVSIILKRAIIRKHSAMNKAYRRKIYGIVSSFLKRADLSVRFFDILANAGTYSNEWRFIAHHGGQWLPIILEVRTCEEYFQQLVAARAIFDSIEAVPFGEYIFEPIPGSSFETLHFGTPENEARREEFIERRKLALVEQKLVEYPTPYAHIWVGFETHLKKSPWTGVNVYLDVPEVTPTLINNVSIALGRKSELLGIGEISGAIKAVLRGEGGMIDSPAPPGYANWPDYIRMLYRSNRFMMKPEVETRVLAFINGDRHER